jgi:peptidoglycan/LPS O-acetylase OafA/YrhL
MPYHFLASSPSDYMWDHSLKAPVALLLLTPVVFADRAGGLVRSALRLRPIAYLGLVSYGVYLWHARILSHIATPDALNRHGPLSAAPAILVGTAVTVAIASVSYHVLERPALRLGARPRSRRRP